MSGAKTLTPVRVEPCTRCGNGQGCTAWHGPWFLPSAVHAGRGSDPGVGCNATYKGFPGPVWSALTLFQLTLPGSDNPSSHAVWPRQWWSFPSTPASRLSVTRDIQFLLRELTRVAGRCLCKPLPLAVMHTQGWAHAEAPTRSSMLLARSARSCPLGTTGLCQEHAPKAR